MRFHLLLKADLKLVMDSRAPGELLLQLPLQVGLFCLQHGRPVLRRREPSGALLCRALLLGQGRAPLRERRLQYRSMPPLLYICLDQALLI